MTNAISLIELVIFALVAFHGALVSVFYSLKFILRLFYLIKCGKYQSIMPFLVVEWVSVGIFIELLALGMKRGSSALKIINGEKVFSISYNYRWIVADLYFPLLWCALDTLLLMFLLCYTFSICLGLSAFFDFCPIPLLLIVKKIPCVLDGTCSLTKTEKKVLVFTVLGWVWVFISYDSIYRDYSVTWQAFLEGLEVWKSILTFLLGR